MLTLGGPWLLVEHVCGETQEEILQYFVLVRSDVDDDGTSCRSTSINKNDLLFELKLAQNLDSLWQCERSVLSM